MAAMSRVDAPEPEFRLPDSTHIGAVHLQVSDLRASIAWYEQIIGLRVVDDARGRVVLAPHGEDRPLVTLRTADGIGPARPGSLGLYHFAILLPDGTVMTASQ